jgi:hypothetical protein
VRISWLAVLFLGISAQAAAEPAATATLLKAAHLLDPRTGDALSPAAVLIENGKIVELDAAALRWCERPMFTFVLRR